MAKRDLVFISYAHEDLNQVRKVYEGLKKRRVNVWIDNEDLKTGRWKPQIMKTISRSKHFVICLSCAALEKTGGGKPGFQDEELQYAYEIAINQPDDKFTIVPVRLEDCGRGDNRTSIFQQYDLFRDWEKELDKLAINLGGGSLLDTTVKDERTEDEEIIDKLMGKGAAFYYTGEYEKSLSIFEALINIKSDSHVAWYSMGAALDYLGRHDEALEASNKAIEIKPDLHEAWSNKGIALTYLGRTDEALEAFNKAIEIKLDSHVVWNNKGNALGSLGRYDEALEAYNKAIEIKPDYQKAWSNKGNTLKKLGRKKEAKEAFKKAEEIEKKLLGR